MIRIYNKNTGWTGRERTDSDLITLQDGEVKLEVIKQAPPKHDPETQRLIKLHPLINTYEKTYTEGWEVENLTAYEIAMRTWEAPQHTLRIVADADLATSEFGIAMYTFFQVNELPIFPKKKEGTVHLYCSEIKEQFQDAVDHLISIEKITIENRPDN